MSRIYLALLGEPRLTRDGKPVEFDTRKATALLAYLALTKSSHTREALAALLYPDYDQSHALAALRRTLSSLNKGLSRPHVSRVQLELIEADRETIGLTPEAPLDVDVHEFQEQLSSTTTHGHASNQVCAKCLSPLTRAVALYRGDLLSGFTLRDSPNFDEWQFFEAETLRSAFSGALDKLVNLHSEKREFTTALEYCRRRLTLDPLDERTHRELMRLYAQSGQRNAALRQYRECVRILEAELAVAPLQETTSLYESIRENRLGEEPKGAAFAPASAEARSPETSIVHPFVGRVKEWQVLSRLLGARETCQWIVIEGEAGIGKTRLAEEFTQRAARMGACTITARCYEGEADLAYGAYIQALRTALGSDRQISKLSSLPLHFQQEVSRILPELTVLGVESPPPTPLDSPGAQVRFFESLSQAVLAILNEGDTPGILFIDDAQWLDKASVELTIYLARRLHEHCLTLLLTWRTEDVDESHPLRRVLGEALRKGQGAHLKLSRLDHDAVREWVRAETKQYGELSERIFRESEGLPFFVVEYLGALSDAGRMDSFSEWSLPRGMRDLIHSRVAMLSETDKQVLTCAAVIGRLFDLDTLHKASGRNEEETVDALEHLLARGLIRETPSAGSPQPQYDFAHDKVRAVVYDEASLARRRLLHGRVAEALAQRTRTLPAKAQIASLVAHHYQLAGQETLAAEYFERAGLYARELFANTEAIAGYRAALAIGHPEPARLHEALGDLLTLNADYDAALKSYENAAALLKASNLAWLEHKLGNVHARRGDWELAELHYQTARNGLGDSALTELARLEADRSFAAHARGDDAQALLFGGQALEFAQNAKDSRALAQAQNLMGILARRAGDDKQACEFLEASLKTANELNDPSIKTAALNNLALVYREEGDLTRARELTETALSLCAALGDRHREAALRSNLSDLLYAMGDQEKAMEQLKSAVVIFAEIGHKSEELQPEIWKLVEW